MNTTKMTNRWKWSDEDETNAREVLVLLCFIVQRHREGEEEELKNRKKNVEYRFV